MRQREARVIQVDPTGAAPMLQLSTAAAGHFDAPRAREACVALIAICERLDREPLHARPADARDDLMAFGSAMCDALRAFLPCASPHALSEAAQALTLLFSPSRLNLELRDADVVTLAAE